MLIHGRVVYEPKVNCMMDPHQILETEYSGFGGQYHAADALAPKVTKASAGMASAV